MVRRSLNLDSLKRRFPAGALPTRLGTGEEPADPGWSLDALAGRLVEVSGASAPASLSAAALLVLEAQRRGEPAAWITARDSTFFPPDFDECGIDLTALPVIFTPSPTVSAKVADTLLRSGGYLLVVLDLGASSRKAWAELPMQAQTRLSGLAARHRSVLVGLTRKTREKPSLGSLFSLRSEGTRRRASFDRFDWELKAIKDKQRGPGWSHREKCRGPDGLC